MAGRTISRIFAVLMIAILLLMNTFPIVGVASFIKPGKAITPGDAITPGKPISGGQFIIPGKAYKPGDAFSGDENLSSGKPIFPGSFLDSGTFLIPNTPPPPPGLLYWQLQGIDPGNAIQGGSATTGGQGPNGGNAIDGGQGPNGGNAESGGQGPNGGNAIDGGQGPNGGNAIDGGQGPNGGNSVDGGQGPNGGNSVDGGQGPNGGNSVDGGQGPDSGNAVDGGQGPDGGNTVDGGQGPDGGNAVDGGQGTDSGNTPTNGESSKGSATEKGINWDLIETIRGKANEAKTWLMGHRTKAENLLDGTLSMVAGFKIKDLNTHIGNRNLHEIMGNKVVTNSSNPVAKWLNKRYQNYLKSFNDSRTILRNGELRSGTQKKAKHMASFFKQNFSFSNTLKTIGDDFSKNWNPFANPFNSNNTGINKVFNKNFFNLKNMAKGNGVVNVLLGTGERIIDYAKNPKKSFASTDFAAGITTDVAFGVGSTAISAGIGWGAAAATGAAFGSVVPGLGTVVGAGAGILLSVALSSEAGRRFKGTVEKGIKKVYDGAINLGSSIKNKLSGIFG